MSNTLIKSNRIEKKVNFLKVLVAISFLIIIVPEEHPVDWTSLMMVVLINDLKDMIMTKMKPFDFFGVMMIGNLMSIVYLACFPLSRKKTRIALAQLAIFLLIIPTYLIISYLILAARVYWLPSIITILIFYVLATILSILLFKQLKNNRP